MSLVYWLVCEDLQRFSPGPLKRALTAALGQPAAANQLASRTELEQLFICHHQHHLKSGGGLVGGWCDSSMFLRAPPSHQSFCHVTTEVTMEVLDSQGLRGVSLGVQVGQAPSSQTAGGAVGGVFCVT